MVLNIVNKFDKVVFKIIQFNIKIVIDNNSWCHTAIKDHYQHRERLFVIKHSDLHVVSKSLLFDYRIFYGILNGLVQLIKIGKFNRFMWVESRVCEASQSVMPMYCYKLGFKTLSLGFFGTVRLTRVCSLTKTI